MYRVLYKDNRFLWDLIIIANCDHRHLRFNKTRFNAEPAADGRRRRRRRFSPVTSTGASKIDVATLNHHRPATSTDVTATPMRHVTSPMCTGSVTSPATSPIRRLRRSRVATRAVSLRASGTATPVF